MILVAGVLIVVSTEAIIKDDFVCADQSISLYLQIVLTIDTPDTMLHGPQPFSLQPAEPLY